MCGAGEFIKGSGCKELSMAYMDCFEEAEKKMISKEEEVAENDEVTDAGCISRYYIRHAEWLVTMWIVCQRVNQEACGVVETMWMQDAELAWNKLEEQVYTVEKSQEINLWSKAGHLSYWCDPEGEDGHDCSMQKTIMLKDGRAGHLSYWCDPEGGDGHDCSMQKTIMLKDGRYGQWKVRMKLLVRGINDDAWIAVKTGWEEPTIFTAEGKKLKPKEPRQGVVREVVQEVVQRMRQRGEVVTFWSKECISHGGEEHSDGCPDVDGAYLVVEKSISMYEDEDNASLMGENGIPSVEVSKWGNVVVEPEGYYDEVTDAECVSRYYIRHVECVCQRVNQEARRVVETMWMQDAELEWDKLEEQVYTVEKRQEINLWSKAGHLSYWCDPEGEDGHDCSMQKTIMLKDGRYGQWKVRMKLLVRGINDDAWIAVKTRWEEPTIFTAEGKKLNPKEPRQGVVREVVREVVQRMRQRGEVVTFWSKECISRGGEEHSDGCPDVDGAYLVGEKSISMYEDEDNASLMGDNGIPSVEVSSVCQRVNQEACRVVETMWMKDAKLKWDKLEEQVYTVEKRQEINLWSKFMP
ncbi:hypothetical protein F2Q69_00026635 [Brassica cretica]|uniref:Uncharacterized protein n=1 Tax=Brassica cretica TaxID=69181 RepID=A0A8S9SCC2_BRACR|nr:hypothetical protein F2Q69_00026635 [Brassica cretica]